MLCLEGITDLLPAHLQEDAQTWFAKEAAGDTRSSPVAHAAQLIQAVTKDHPQDEAVGLFLQIWRFLGTPDATPVSPAPQTAVEIGRG